MDKRTAELLLLTLRARRRHLVRRHLATRWETIAVVNATIARVILSRAEGGVR